MDEFKTKPPALAVLAFPSLVFSVSYSLHMPEHAFKEVFTAGGIPLLALHAFLSTSMRLS